MDEARRECEQMREELDRERVQCRHLVETEKLNSAAAQDKLTTQMSVLKTDFQQVSGFILISFYFMFTFIVGLTVCRFIAF